MIAVLHYRRVVQLLGSLGASMVLSKAVALAAPALLFPVWSPWIRAGMRNLELYAKQYKCVGLWRAQVRAAAGAGQAGKEQERRFRWVTRSRPEQVVEWDGDWTAGGRQQDGKILFLLETSAECDVWPLAASRELHDAVRRCRAAWHLCQGEASH